MYDVTYCIVAPGNKTSHLASLVYTHAQRDYGANTVHAFDKSLARSKLLNDRMMAAGTYLFIIYDIHLHYPCFKNSECRVWFDLIWLHRCTQRDRSEFRFSGSWRGSRHLLRREVSPPRPVLLRSVCSHAIYICPSSHNVAYQSTAYSRLQFIISYYVTMFGWWCIIAYLTGSGVVRALERVLETESGSSSDEKRDDTARLKRLQDFQIQVIAKAMSFPAAEALVYSTCSVHRVS